jgi:hypothetical protein
VLPLAVFDHAVLTNDGDADIHVGVRARGRRIQFGGAGKDAVRVGIIQRLFDDLGIARKSGPPVNYNGDASKPSPYDLARFNALPERSIEGVAAFGDLAHKTNSAVFA